MGRLPQERVSRVAAYVRVSTTDQAEKWSPTMQRERILGYCEAMRLPAPERFYEDDESGKKMEREDFSLLLDHVAAREYTHVVFLRLDRLARNLRGLLSIVDDVFLPADCELACVEYGIDTSTPAGRFIFQIMGASAEFDGAQITERTRLGKLRHVKESGRWWGGSPPYGYTSVGGGTGELVIEPTEAEIVKAAFKLYVRGKTTYREVAMALDAAGYRPRPVRRRSGEGHQPEGFSPQTVKNIILRRSFYLGQRTVMQGDQTGAAAPAHPAILE